MIRYLAKVVNEDKPIQSKFQFIDIEFTADYTTSSTAVSSTPAVCTSSEGEGNKKVPLTSGFCVQQQTVVSKDDFSM